MKQPTELIVDRPRHPLNAQAGPLKAALTLAQAFPTLPATSLTVHEGLTVHLHLDDVAAFGRWVEALELSPQEPMRYQHLGQTYESWTAAGVWAEVPLVVKAYPAEPVADEAPVEVAA